MNSKRPGAVVNRYVNVISQGLYSALLIHLTGGRIETHFHVFGSLAFFAFYRDLRVLLVGTAVVALDHLLRGVFLPQSVFGIFTESNWRWMEHAAWVLFEDFFLGYACFRGISEMKEVSRGKAEVMAQHERAEALVQERTSELRKEHEELQRRNHTIETIYANVKSGFLLVDESLTIQEGFTDSCKSLLSASTVQGMTLTEVLGMHERDAGHFKMMLEQVFEDVLPEDVSMDQIPSRHQVGNRSIKVEGGAVRGPDRKVKSILFTINDITDLQRTESQNTTNLALIKILQRRDAFCRFVLDSKESILHCREVVKNDDQLQTRFILHSLKGNASVFGLEELASMIHGIEDKERVGVSDIQEVELMFKDFLGRHSGILGIEYDEPLVETYGLLTEDGVEELLGTVSRASSRQQTEDAVTAWVAKVKMKSVSSLLSPMVEMGHRVAQRLSKDVRIELENPNLLIDGELLRPVIQNIVHLVRNSIDHGIEHSAERGPKGGQGRITLRFDRSDGCWVIRVSDDGRGVDVNRVYETAEKLGLLGQREKAESMSDRDKAELIFMDGLSTSGAVTQLSGRGVGMSAVKDAVARVRGTIRMETSKGQGTSFEIKVPFRQGDATEILKTTDAVA